MLVTSISGAQSFGVNARQTTELQPTTTTYAAIAQGLQKATPYTEQQVKEFFASNPGPEQIADKAAALGLIKAQIIEALKIAGPETNDESLNTVIEHFVDNSELRYTWGIDGALTSAKATAQAVNVPSSPYSGVAGAYQNWLEKQPNKDAGKADVSFITWSNMQSRTDLLRLYGVNLSQNQQDMLAQADAWTAQGMPLQEQLDRARAAGKSQIDIDTVLSVTRYHSKPDQYPTGLTGIKDKTGHNLTLSEANKLLAIPLSIDPLDPASYGMTVTAMGLNQEQQAHLQAIRFGVQYFPTIGCVSGVNIDYAGNPIDAAMGGSAGRYSHAVDSNANGS